VTKDRDEAVAWLQKAAVAGHQRAILALSDLDKAEQQAMNEGAAQKPPEPGAPATDAAAEPATAEAPATGSSGGTAPDATSSSSAAMVTPPATVEPPPAADSSGQAAAEAPTTETQPTPPATAEAPPTTAEAPSAEPQAPATGGDTQTAEVVPAVPPPETPPAAAEPATPPDMQIASVSTINVQMSSQKTRSEAEGSVEKLKAVYAKVVEPYDFYVKEVDLGKPKGIWYRVLVGPIPSEKDARALCAKIKSEPPHNDCLVQLK
jgi:hypothetical protein